MLALKFAAAVATTLVSLAPTVSALPKISRGGRFLYEDSGKRFYIKGVSYQEQGLITSTDPTAFPEPSQFFDPLADPNGCKRDLPYLQSLGINAIRVYSVNASNNHDECMSMFSQAGIYTIIDLSLPVNGSIDRASPSWSTNLLDLYLGTVEVFSKYDNVLAYNVGNEVANDVATTSVMPFVKAAARDVKAYLKSKNLNTLIGYAATDQPNERRVPLANYLGCGSEAESIDLFGLNNYEWCGDASISAYQNTISAFANYTLPAYFSEFGCVTSPPRLWTEVQALYGSQMTPYWSGGLAFSYFPAVGGYGLVNISSDGNTVTTGDDWNRLKTQYTQIDITKLPNSPSQSSAGSTSFPACAAPTTSFLASNTLPPTPDTTPCNCLLSTFGCLFTPQTPNYTVILGDLLDYSCSLLGQNGGNCDAISANGTTGTYGSLSSCSPEIKLSYVFTQYWQDTNRNQQSCNFNQNATLNSNAPSSNSAAQSAASSCLSSSPASTFTPSSVPVPSATGSGSSGSGSGSPSGGNGGSGGHSGASHNLALLDLRAVGLVASAIAACLAGGIFFTL